jgi:hypothetical protein
MYCGPPAQRREIAVAHCDCIGDEHQVELAVFGGLRDLGVVPEISPRIDLRLWMQPGGNMVAGWVEECAELHRLTVAFVAHRTSP